MHVLRMACVHVLRMCIRACVKDVYMYTYFTVNGDKVLLIALCGMSVVAATIWDMSSCVMPERYL